MEMPEKFAQAAFATLFKAFLAQNMRTKVLYCLFRKDLRGISYAHHSELHLNDRVIRPGAQVGSKIVLIEPGHVTVKLDGLGEVRYHKTEVVRL
jgi:hypothetical protein